MSSIAVSVDFHPEVSDDYFFTVKCAGEEVSLNYTETICNVHLVIHFGSIEEMESVAKIMLSTAKAWKEGFSSK